MNWEQDLDNELTRCEPVRYFRDRICPDCKRPKYDCMCNDDEDDEKRW